MLWLFVACHRVTTVTEVEPTDWLEPIDPDAPPVAGAPEATGRRTLDFPSGLWCTSLSRGGDVVVVNVDLGEYATVVSSGVPLSNGRHINGLAELPNEIVFCDKTLSRISLTDGERTDAEVTCDSAADFDGQLHLLSAWPERPVTVAADFDAVAEDNETLPIEPYASRLGRVEGEALLSAWHSAPDVDRWATDVPETVPLQQFDTWIDGLSGVPGSLVVLDDGRDGLGTTWEKALHHFDYEGRRLARVELGQVALAGLSCSVYPEILADWVPRTNDGGTVVPTTN